MLQLLDNVERKDRSGGEVCISVFELPFVHAGGDFINDQTRALRLITGRSTCGLVQQRDYGVDVSICTKLFRALYLSIPGNAEPLSVLIR